MMCQFPNKNTLHLTLTTASLPEIVVVLAESDEELLLGGNSSVGNTSGIKIHIGNMTLSASSGDEILISSRFYFDLN